MEYKIEKDIFIGGVKFCLGGVGFLFFDKEVYYI